MNEIPFKEYIHQVWKRRKIVTIFLVTVLIFSFLFTVQQDEVYRAVTVLEIGTETPDIALVQDVVNVSPYYSWWSALRYYETQYEIIKSRSMLEKAAERAMDAGLFERMSTEAVTNRLIGGLTIGSDEKSRLVRIFYDDTEPERAMKVSNIIAETYVDLNLSTKLGGIAKALTFLRKRLIETTEEKKIYQEELQTYMEENRLLPAEDQELSLRNNLISLNQKLNDLKSNRIELEARYKKLAELVRKTVRAEDLLGVSSSNLLDKLKTDLSELRSEKSRLKSRYKEKHPRIVAINAQIQEIEVLIRKEVENDVNRIRTQFLMAQAEEKAIGKALEDQKVEALKVESMNRKLEDLRVVTETNQNLYEALQKKIKEADLSSLVRVNNVRIMDRPTLPGRPIRPNPVTNLALALVIGLLGGIGLALVIEYLDDTFKNHEDVERYLDLPTLGLIPRYELPKVEGEEEPAEPREVDVAFLPATEPSSPISEFYRTLRTNVLFLTAKGIKRIMLVSTAPEEGKTVTAINLGITMAQMGEKTVVIDLDLRRPKLNRKFKSKITQGITNWMVNEISFDDVIQESEIQNLDYVLAGSIPPNPAELLSSSKINEFLEELDRRYDRVIIDSSPIAPVTDSTIITQYVDGVIMVIRAGKVHRKSVIRACDQLTSVDAKILGVVLNDIDFQKSTYENYQYYKYGYYKYDETMKPGESTRKKIMNRIKNWDFPRLNG